MKRRNFLAALAGVVIAPRVPLSTARSPQQLQHNRAVVHDWVPFPRTTLGARNALEQAQVLGYLDRAGNLLSPLLYVSKI